MTLTTLVVGIVILSGGLATLAAVACRISASKADDREQRGLRDLVRERQP